MLLANILGRSVFGEYAIVQSTAVSIAVFAQFGTGNIAAKYVAELRESDPARAGRILALGGLMAAACSLVSGAALVAISPWLTSQILHKAELSGSLMLSAIYLISSALASYQIAVLTGLEKYRLLGVIHACCAIGQILAAGVAALLFSVPGAVGGTAAMTLVRWLILQELAKRELRASGIAITFRGLSRETSVISRVALPTGITALTIVPAMWLGNILLCRQSGGFALMASYSACSNMLTAVLFLPWVIDKVTISLLNRQIGIRDHSGYRQIFWFNLRSAFACAIGGATLIVILGPGLLRLYGKSFAADGFPTLAVLIAASVPEVVSMALNQLFLSRERIWTGILGVILLRETVLVLCAYLMIPARGSLGLAVAYLLSRMVGAASSSIMAFRIGLDAAQCEKL